MAAQSEDHPLRSRENPSRQAIELADRLATAYKGGALTFRFFDDEWNLAIASLRATAVTSGVRERLIESFLPKCMAFGTGDTPRLVATEFADTALASLAGDR